VDFLGDAGKGYYIGREEMRKEDGWGITLIQTDFSEQFFL